MRIYVPLVPAVPNHYIGPVVCPGHVEKVEAAILEDLHPVVFDGDLHVGRTGPVSETGFGIFGSHDHYVQGLSGPEVTDGHRG